MKLIRQVQGAVRKERDARRVAKSVRTHEATMAALKVATTQNKEMSK